MAASRLESAVVIDVWNAHPLDYGEGYKIIRVDLASGYGVDTIQHRRLGIKIGDELWFRTHRSVSRFVGIKNRK